MLNEASLFTALLLGLLLGLKHALDADHIVAVTTVVSRTRSILRAVFVGLTWGIGHSLTLFLVGFGVLILKLTIPDRLALSMEFAVGLMLLALGVPLLWRLRKRHLHLHQHGNISHLHSHSHAESPDHQHRHMVKTFAIGMAHGLAGSGALTILVLNTMSSVGQGLVFMLLFGIGSMASMLTFSGLVSIPFRVTAAISDRFALWTQGAAGVLSIVVGLIIMWQTGLSIGLSLALP